MSTQLKLWKSVRNSNLVGIVCNLWSVPGDFRSRQNLRTLCKLLAVAISTSEQRWQEINSITLSKNIHLLNFLNQNANNPLLHWTANLKQANGSSQLSILTVPLDYTEEAERKFYERLCTFVRWRRMCLVKEGRNSTLGRRWSVDRLQRAVIYFS